ncbi:hypothetical protein MTO96_035416 [Rhipicephalus appendiculatus]
MAHYNEKDYPLEATATDVTILPGVHVLRIRIFESTQGIEYYYDRSPLIKGYLYNIDQLNLIKINTENGRVFEAHFVADNDADVFRNAESNPPEYAPPLTPGAYVSVFGAVACKLVLISLSGVSENNLQLIRVSCYSAG